MTRVVIVGSGAGGLASAARLATRRHDVTVLEAQDTIGGRLRPVDLAPSADLAASAHDADGGRQVTLVPPVITLPAPLRDLFNKTGRGLETVLDLREATPTRVFGCDGRVVDVPSAGPAAVADALGDFDARAAREYRQLMADAAQIWQEVRRPLLETPGGTARWLVDELGTWKAMRLLRPQTSFARACAIVSHHDVRALLDLDALEAGSLPKLAPAWLITRPYVRALFGEWEVPGGLGALADVLQQRAVDRGAVLRTGVQVVRVLVDDGRATGVVLGDGEQVPAEWVVADIDDVSRLAPVREPRTSEATISTVIVELQIPDGAVGSGAVGSGAVGSGAGALRGVVLPTDRDAAVKALASTELASDWWLRVEVSANRMTIRVFVNDQVDLASAESREMLTAAVLARLVERSVLATSAGVTTNAVLTPADVSARLGGRLFGAASSGPWNGLLRPPVSTEVSGLLRAGGSVLAGPGFPYAVQTGEVVADIIGRARPGS